MARQRSLLLLASLLLLVLPGGLAAPDLHFSGGSMSFEFLNQTQVWVTIISGWTLGQGPCGPGCDQSHVGQSTDLARAAVLATKPDYFGSWSTELRLLGSRYPNTTIITPYVNSHLHGYVWAVNPVGTLNWELEVANFSLEVPVNTSYIDVSIGGSAWRSIDYKAQNPKNFDLQVKIKASRRNDTDKPNGSPIAMFKPVYKILLNQVTELQLTSVDPDGDLVECEIGRFVNSGRLEALPGVTVEKSCLIRIDADESKGLYKDGGWGAIAIIMNDFNRETIQLEGAPVPLSPGHAPLSTIPLQFMIQTVRELFPPEFLDPTPASGQRFQLYVGSTLVLELSAAPNNHSNKDIASFFLAIIPRRHVQVSSLQSDPGRPGVKTAFVKWQLGPEDVGLYRLQARVTDVDGTEGEERSYHLEVKDVPFNDSRNQNSGAGPYFANLPPTGIRCRVNSTCAFPLYIKDADPSAAILAVEVSNSLLQGVKAGPVTKATRQGQQLYLSEITLPPNPDPGNYSITIRASDSKNRNVEGHLLVNTYAPDACLDLPCKPRPCITIGTDFRCVCGPGKTGKLCDKTIDPCDSHPCQHGGSCLSIPYMPGVPFCKCTADYTGLRCEKSLFTTTESTTNSTTIATTTGKGTSATAATIANSTPELNVCDSHPCQHGGSCITSPRMPGLPFCMCTASYMGLNCEKTATVPPTNAHGEERHDVECTERSMKISIPSYLLPQGNVTLLDPSCPLTLNGTDYVIDVGLSQCGTTIHFTDDHVVFVNTILTKTDTGAVDLTVPVGCQYPRLSNVSIAYMPLTHQARFFETNWGKLDVSMEQYKDDQFSTSLGVAGSVARMSAGQTVYLQIHIHDVSQADLGVMPRICVVSPSPSPLESNVDLIIRNGCPVHEHVRLLPSPGPAYFRFAFTADTFRFDSGLVYVHCETSLCELGPSCPAFCGSQGNVNATSLPSGATAKPTGNTTLSVPFGRRRRSAEIPKESGTLLSAGPLLLVDEADAHAVPAGLVATIASIAAAAMVVVVALAVALHRARARNASVEKRLTAISVK